MPKVHILPPDVIAKIAAGEVVDRPASVVKELMENSLDAGAAHVEVHLSAGGKTLIQVKDNGCGIAREDMDMLFSRHATSKVSSGADLENILSLGFRGEALYSVGSVAELTLRSRAASCAEAWEMKVRGGERSAAAPAAMPAAGTDIRVEEIFFNTPARKKFLKSDAAEFDQAAHVFLPYALLYPERHFILSHKSRVVYDLPPAADAAARAAKALALDARHIIPFEGGSGDVRVSGLLGDINIQRPRRDLQFVFVNGRPVQSKGLLFQMNDVFRLIMPDGAHPFFVVFLTVPPGDVDVNIHPAKREVRIKDEGRAGSILRGAAENALMRQGSAKEMAADVFTFEPGVMPKEEGVAPQRMVFAPGQKSVLPSAPVARPASAPPEKDFFQFTGELAARREDDLKDRLLRARFIGTFIQKYHLFEEGGAMFVLDQHAAQERILFELFTRQMGSGKMEVERLLTPVIVKLSPRELLLWESVRPAIESLGFEAGLMGEDALALQAYPRLIRAPEAAFRALLSEDVQGPSNRDMLARRACRASVMSGDRMHADEAREQLKRLAACQDPFTCPHGRPVFIELKESFLDRQFLRV